MSICAIGKSELVYPTTKSLKSVEKILAEVTKYLDCVKLSGTKTNHSKLVPVTIGVGLAGALAAGVVYASKKDYEFPEIHDFHLPELDLDIKAVFPVDKIQIENNAKTRAVIAGAVVGCIIGSIYDSHRKFICEKKKLYRKASSLIVVINKRLAEQSDDSEVLDKLRTYKKLLTEICSDLASDLI